MAAKGVEEDVDTGDRTVKTMAEAAEMLRTTVAMWLEKHFAMPKEGVQLVLANIPVHFHKQDEQRQLVQENYTVKSISEGTVWGISVDVDGATEKQQPHFGYTIYRKNPTQAKKSGHIFITDETPPYVRPPLNAPVHYHQVSFAGNNAAFHLTGTRYFFDN